MKPSIVSRSSFAKNLNSELHAQLSGLIVYDADKGNAHCRHEGGNAPAPDVIEMFGR